MPILKSPQSLATLILLSLSQLAILTSGSAIPLPAQLQLEPRQATPARHSTKIKSLVVIGDSFSDNGNGAYQLTNRTWPADPAYFHGRFCNGPVWVEDVAQKFGWELEDYAVGGSTSNSTAVQGYTGANSTIPSPSALDQTTSYLSTSPSHAQTSSSVYAILTGANDIFFNPSIPASSTVSSVSAIVSSIAKIGGRKFAIATYPDFSRIPYGARYADDATKVGLRSYSVALHSGIVGLSQKLRKQGLEVALVDGYALFEDVFAHPGRYGFSAEEVKSGRSCLEGAYGEAPRRVCEDPERYVWWDEYHPTRKSQMYLGELAEKVMKGTFGV